MAMNIKMINNKTSEANGFTFLHANYTISNGCDFYTVEESKTFYVDKMTFVNYIVARTSSSLPYIEYDIKNNCFTVVLNKFHNNMTAEELESFIIGQKKALEAVKLLNHMFCFFKED